MFGIVKQSGGSIGVYSELGHGTTFKIYFPRYEEAPVSIRKEEEKPLRGGSETILLVVDAAPLRQLTRRLLEDCGYTVLNSGDPAEALCIAGKAQRTTASDDYGRDDARIQRACSCGDLPLKCPNRCDTSTMTPTNVGSNTLLSPASIGSTTRACY